MDWAMNERRRLLEEIAVLPPSDTADVQTAAALAYLRDRLNKLNTLINALETSER